MNGRTNFTAEAIRFEQSQCGSCATPNISESERFWSLVAGGALVAFGLGTRSLKSWLSLGAGAGMLYRGWSGHCSLYERLGLNTAVDHHDRVGVRAQHGQKILASVQIDADPETLYNFWRKLDNLPRIMRHLESVTRQGPRHSWWLAKGPLGTRIEWAAEIITDKPGEMIAWRSLPGSMVDSAGSVHFEPLGQGTDLHVTLKYDPPGGRIVAELADLLGQGLERQVREDLQQFKRFIEQASQEEALDDEPEPYEAPPAG